jgi:hypothetical protein
VLDKNVDRLRQLDLVFGNRISTVYSNAQKLEDAVLDADLVIGGVLIPGAAAPKLVTRDMVVTHEARARWWWTWPSTRAAVSRPRMRRPMPSRPSWWTAWCITAWPTCPAPWRARRPLR